MMFKTAKGSIVTKFNGGEFSNIRTAQNIAPSHQAGREPVCFIKEGYLYTEVAGLHGDQMETRENHPGYGQKRGNQNSDFFLWEETLLKYVPKYGMYAFETWRGKDNLENHDETKVLGDIPDVWPEINNKRISMLVRTDKNRAWSICESVRKGSVTDVSMGVLVNHSYCTVCGNKAEIEESWCPHLRTAKGQFLHPDRLDTPSLRDKWPKGVWACEDNRGVFGIEVSWITVGEGADPDAKVLNILAGDNGPEGKQFNNGRREASIADLYWDRAGR